MHVLKYSGGRRTSGYSLLTAPGDNDHVEEGETLSCAHCQYTWTVRPGSGSKRGFCLRCNAPVCGKRDCLERCEPWEAKIEAIENRTRLYAALKRLGS